MILRKLRLLVLALILVSLSAFGRSHNLEATHGLLDSSSQREKDFAEPLSLKPQVQANRENQENRGRWLWRLALTSSAMFTPREP